MIPIRDQNPYQRFPFLTLAFIALNIYAFFAAQAFPEISEAAAFRWGAVPCDLLGRCEPLSAQLEQAFPDRTSLETLFTSMFMHGSILHLGFNMLFLWVFGNNVEDRLGHVRFFVFYLLTGLAAAFAHILFQPGSAVPVIGASGAVSGVLGAYIVLWPRAPITSIFFLGIIPIPVVVPAWFQLGLWFVLQVFGALAGIGRLLEGGAEEGGVAFLAHVGGFLAGVVGIRIFAPRPRARDRPLPEWLQT